MAERRKRNRKTTLHLTKVLNRNTEKSIGRLVNITTDGMMLISKKELEVGVILPFRLILPWMVNDKHDLEFNAEIRWCKPDTNPNYYAIGFKLLNITRENRDIIEEVFHEFHLVG